MNATNISNILKEYTLLYVEDNKEISEEIVFFLEPKFKELHISYDGKEGLEAFKKHKPDMIITDLQMPNMNGIDMIAKIRELDSTVPIIITTAFNESSYLLKAIELQVDGYQMKPTNMKELINRLYKIVEPIELKKELKMRNEELVEINHNLDKIAKEKTEKLKHLYNHDALTGLSNFVNLGEEIDSGDFQYLILLDISNFSIMNKQYGKVFANNILQETAQTLKNHINVNTRLFKTESDHFVFLSKDKSEEKIEEFCQQIISFFDTQTLLVEELDVSISFSIGIAKIEEGFFPLLNAEYALEIGKKLGSRYYYFYDDDIESVNKAKESIRWINITKDMIQNDRIKPFYQPIIDINTGEIIKYEVLARGEYNGEFLSPYFFVAQAERLGMIGSITRMMINKSFNHFEGSGMAFSINITQRDLLDTYLISFLEKKLKNYSIHPSRVTFEVLENITIGDQQILVLKQLKALKNMGFEIAIDDFGVENSNFSRLLEIDFDYIKLDGVFIKGLAENTKDRIIVSAIVSLAKTLGIKTVAEYVESEEIYKIIKECGVDMAQGYFIGKPLAHCVGET